MMKIAIENPEFRWAALSLDCRNLLERLVGLYNGRNYRVTFEVGQLPTGASSDPWGKIVVTDDHIDEIRRYVDANRHLFAVAEFTDTSCVLKWNDK